MVEHNLAKVGVVGSNPITRSISKYQGLRTECQVTVSKRLTFGNKSLLFYGVRKVSGILCTKDTQFFNSLDQLRQILIGD